MLILDLGVSKLFLSEEKVRASLEFTCIQPYTPAQLCLPSPHERKAPISFGTGCWSYWGPPGHCQLSGDRYREHSSLLMLLSGNVTCLCLQKAAQALGGSWMRQAHAQPQQTRSTEHVMATIKAADLSTSMEGLCYISAGLNYQETPGQNARKYVFCK